MLLSFCALSIAAGANVCIGKRKNGLRHPLTVALNLTFFPGVLPRRQGQYTRKQHEAKVQLKPCQVRRFRVAILDCM